MTFLAPARLGELLCNATLACTTASRHLVDDPLHFILQASRRLPRHTREMVGAVLQTGAARKDLIRHALAYWIVDRPDEARTSLARVKTPDSTRIRSRLYAELAVHLGRADLIPAPILTAFPAIRARALWYAGSLTEAVQAAHQGNSKNSLEARLTSELRVVTPGGLMPRDATTSNLPRQESDQIRVVHLLTNSLPHTQSGYTHRSHSVLAAQQRAGINVAAVTRLGYPVSVGKIGARHTDVVDGVTYHRLVAAIAERTAEERVQQGTARLIPLARESNAEVLHATTNFMNALVARSAAEILGIPWVYEVRGLLEDTWVASRPRGAEQAHASLSEKYRMLRARETEMANSADHVFTLSQTLRGNLIERGVPGSKISIVPNAIDEALLTADLSSQAARRVLGLPENGFWVGTVSSLVDYEGLDTLIDAIALLRTRGHDVRGLVVGEGVSRPALEERTRTLNISHAVRFTGKVPRSKTPLFYQALDVFVVPRRDLQVCRTVTPLKPVEAMACARPVVATDLPALAELIRNNRDGILVPTSKPTGVADAIERLLDDPILLSAFGRAARMAVRERTWDNVGAIYKARYASLLTRGGNTG